MERHGKAAGSLLSPETDSSALFKRSQDQYLEKLYGDENHCSSRPSPSSPTHMHIMYYAAIFASLFLTMGIPYQFDGNHRTLTRLTPSLKFHWLLPARGEEFFDPTNIPHSGVTPVLAVLKADGGAWHYSDDSQDWFLLFSTFTSCLINRLEVAGCSFQSLPLDDVCIGRMGYAGFEDESEVEDNKLEESREQRRVWDGFVGDRVGYLSHCTLRIKNDWKQTKS